MDKATPAAGRASRAPELDTARDCDIGELETSSASCSVTDSFAASYIEPAVTRVLVSGLFGGNESVIPPTLFVLISNDHKINTNESPLNVNRWSINMRKNPVSYLLDKLRSFNNWTFL